MRKVRQGSGRGIAGRVPAEGSVLRARELRARATPAERGLWNLLRDRQLKGLAFRRQQTIGPFFADFYCDALGLVVEVDGGIHDEQQARDDERSAYLAERGLQALRFRNEEVLLHPDRVLKVISRLFRPPSPSVSE